LRFVSLNAWGGQVWEALSAWVPSVGADILCLQEMIRAPVASPDWLAYRDAFRSLDQRADLLGDISALLLGYQTCFAAAARGPLQDGAGRIYPSEHGIAFWGRRELAIAEYTQGFIHGAYRPDGWGAEPVPRAIQAARIHDPESGREVVFAHFHGLRDPEGKHDTPARKSQTTAILAALDKLRRPGDPVILAGDFNLLPDSEAFDRLAGAGLTELVTTRGFTDTRTALYTKPQRFADYLLVSPEVKVRAFDVPAEPVVSDHRALVLDFEL